jgi:hypothetical protein
MHLDHRAPPASLHHSQATGGARAKAPPALERRVNNAVNTRVAQGTRVYRREHACSAGRASIQPLTGPRRQGIKTLHCQGIKTLHCTALGQVCHYTCCIVLTYAQEYHPPPSQGQQASPFKLTIGESIDRIKEEFSFLQAQYNR